MDDWFVEGVVDELGYLPEKDVLIRLWERYEDAVSDIRMEVFRDLMNEYTWQTVR